MKLRTPKVILIAVVASCIALSTTTPALAHVVVKPNEAVTADYQTFTIGVPNERQVPTTSVRLVIPGGLTNVTPNVKLGWQISMDKDGSGEDANVKSITWSDGAIDSGLRDEFTFSGKVPAQPGELQWKAYQTYADGVMVSWDKVGSDKGDSEDATSGPFSTTRIVGESTATTALHDAEQSAFDANTMASRGLYVGGIGLFIGLVALYLATRKRVL